MYICSHAHLRTDHRFLVVEPVHPDQVYDLTWLLVFFRFILKFNGVMLSVVGIVPIDNEAPVVTLSISRFAGPTRFFEGAHRGRVCMCAFLGVSVLSCVVSVCVSNWVSQKKNPRTPPIISMFIHFVRKKALFGTIYLKPISSKKISTWFESKLIPQES